MGLNRLSVLLSTLVFCQSAAAAELSCPEIDDNPLASVELFDGPFSDNAILAPDSFTGTETNGASKWDVTYVFEAGRILNVICRYKNDEKTAEIHSAVKLKSCELETSATTGSRFTCR